MAYLLSQNKLVSLPQTYTSRFFGSNKYIFEDGCLIEKKKECKDDMTLKAFCDKSRERSKKILAAIEFINRVEVAEPAEREYKLNVKKVRARAWALFNTRQGQKHMSFNTISFPIGFSDDDAFKCFNVFLTRCRKKAGLKNYLWVSERQKNGTIHFHMITTEYMPIKQINSFMAVCLSKYFDAYKGTEAFARYATKEEFQAKYNGVDVESVRNCERNKGKLANYITKYISKENTITFSRLVWHCSRSVSALFTDINITEDEVFEIIEHMNNNGFEAKYLEINEFVSVFYLNVSNGNDYYHVPDEYLKDLYIVNTEILDMYAESQNN